MKKLLTLILTFVVFASYSQERELYTTSQQKKLQGLSAEISSQQDLNYQKALKTAIEKKWQLDGNLRNDRIFKLYGLDDTGHPLYLATESNAKAAITTRTNQLYTGGSLGLSLNGNSPLVINKLAIWDGGGVLTTHQELGSSRVTQQDKVTGTNAHSTHVSGTLIAQGVAALAKGMAFGANLKAWDFNSDATEMTSAASNLLISNHSYGFLAGWSYDDTRSRWSWYGNPSISQTEDYKFGFYDTNTQAWDKIAYNAPYYLIVKSAGNNRGETGPTTAGEYYYLGSSSDTSSVTRSKNDGYDILATTSTAKNILTVGAVNSTDGIAPLQSSDIQISSFSSWGPTDDGRIKPDIVAVGVDILSSTDASTTSYAIYSGTSMSSPQAAGSILLLQELYAKQNDGLLMRSSTLKGLVLHTADDAGNAGPDYIYGWGLLNMEKAAKVILNTDKSYSITERTLATGETYSQKIIASGKEILTATICWTDPEGTSTTASSSNLNNRTPKLINDLDIKISDGSSTFLPFILDPENPNVAATRGDNLRDNVEQILIPDAIPGKTYTITISNKNTLKNNSQDYALIISGVGGTEYCTSTPITVQNNIESIKLGDLTSGYRVSSLQKVPLEISFKGNSSKNTLVYIDWNIDGKFDETTELVTSSSGFAGVGIFKTTINVPAGLTIGNSTLMRVISSDNVAIANLGSCGTYLEGFTQDYKIDYVRPSNDLAVTALISPETNNFCSNSTNTVSVSIKNLGTNVQKNIPVSVKISNETGLVTTLTGTYQDSISVFSEATLNLDGVFNAKSGSNYTFEVNANLLTDQDLTNNVKTFTRQITLSPAPTSAQAIVCEGATTISVSGSTTETLLWYDAPTAGNLLFTGSSGSFNKPTNTTKVYAGINDISGSFGPKDKYAFGGGSYYDNFGPEPIIVTQTPLVIESAKVYVGTSGKITFTIYRLSDSTPISSVTLDVKATRTSSNSTRSNNQLIDDLTDQGVLLTLNLAIPTAGTYVLSQTCSNGASIYRTNINANSTVAGTDIVGYPFAIPNVISITGALYNGSTIKTGYYYAYDMKVKSYGCPSSRAEVAITTKTAPKASISPTTAFSLCLNDTKSISTTLSTNYSYQWLLDGQNISGATSSTYQVGQAGSFSVKVTENGLCSAISPSIAVTVLPQQVPQITMSGSSLTLSSGTSPTWYYNGSLITDATTNSIVPLSSGVYQAKVVDTNGCSVYSNGYAFTITAVEEEVVTDEIAKISPNPAREKFKIEYADPQNNPKYVLAELINIIGVPISSQELVKTKGVYSAEFDVSKESSGKFFIRITSDKTTKIIPLVVAASN